MNTQEIDILFTDIPHQLYRIGDYAILSKLGRGSYGRVYLAKNKQNKFLYALKKLKIDEGIPTTTLREISLLKILQHPNIINLHQVLVSDKRIYMIMEYMKMSLNLFLRDFDVSSNLLQSFMFQLLQATAFCHNRRVLHRDIKSQNILVNHSMKIVKLCDFGLSRKIGFCPGRLTPTVVTLYYRSPELILNEGIYFSGVDIWSLGCVFVEMVLKHPPFRVDGEIQLFFSWFTQLGVPNDDDMPGAKVKFESMNFQESKNSFNAIKLLKTKVNSKCFDLIMQMFIYNPLKRIGASAALLHEYFHDFDRSVAPAIGEENVGFPEEINAPRKPQVLYLTTDHLEGLNDQGNMETK